MTFDRDQWLTSPEPGTTPTDLPFLALDDNFVSGDAGGDRFRIRYYRADADTRLLGKILFGAGAQGPPDHVHGGAMAAILDEAMGGVAWQAGHPVVAANLNINYRQMLPLTVECLVETEIVTTENRKINVRAVLRDRSRQTVYVEATGLFIVLDENRLQGMTGEVDGIVKKFQEQQKRRERD